VSNPHSKPARGRRAPAAEEGASPVRLAEHDVDRGGIPAPAAASRGVADLVAKSRAEPDGHAPDEDEPLDADREVHAGEGRAQRA
jgi:hypothetical protein